MGPQPLDPPPGAHERVVRPRVEVDAGRSDRRRCRVDVDEHGRDLQGAGGDDAAAAARARRQHRLEAGGLGREAAHETLRVAQQHERRRGEHLTHADGVGPTAPGVLGVDGVDVAGAALEEARGAAGAPAPVVERRAHRSGVVGRPLRLTDAVDRCVAGESDDVGDRLGRDRVEGGEEGEGLVRLAGSAPTVGADPAHGRLAGDEHGLAAFCPGPLGGAGARVGHEQPHDRPLAGGEVGGAAVGVGRGDDDVLGGDGRRPGDGVLDGPGEGGGGEEEVQHHERDRGQPVVEDGDPGHQLDLGLGGVVGAGGVTGHGTRRWGDDRGSRPDAADPVLEVLVPAGTRRGLGGHAGPFGGR